MAISTSWRARTGRSSTRGSCGANGTAAAGSRSMARTFFIVRKSDLTAAKRCSRVAGETFHRPNSSRQAATISPVTSSTDSICISLVSHCAKKCSPRAYARRVCLLHPRAHISQVNLRINSLTVIVISPFVACQHLGHERGAGGGGAGRSIAASQSGGERRRQGGDPRFFSVVAAPRVCKLRCAWKRRPKKVWGGCLDDAPPRRYLFPSNGRPWVAGVVLRAGGAAGAGVGRWQRRRVKRKTVARWQGRRHATVLRFTRKPAAGASRRGAAAPRLEPATT